MLFRSTARQSISFSADHLPAMDYLCEKLGKSRSALVSDILDDALPTLYETVKQFEKTVKKGDKVSPKELALAQSLRMMAKMIESED